jgi:hypothetical protein
VTAVCDEAETDETNPTPSLVVAPMIDGTFTNLPWLKEFQRPSVIKFPSITGAHMLKGAFPTPGYGILVLATDISYAVLFRMQAMTSTSVQFSLPIVLLAR